MSSYIIRTSSEYTRDELVRLFPDAKISTVELPPRLTSGTLIKPDDPRTPLVTTIAVNGNTSTCLLPERCDHFKAIVKDRLRYRWNGDEWQRIISEYSGPVQDRAIELACSLLDDGYPCMVPGELVECIQHRDYAPEQTRWLKARLSGKYAGWFSLEWSKREDLYDQMIRLPGAKYYDRSLLLPPECVDEVVDLINTHSFAISHGAQSLLEQMRGLYGMALEYSTDDLYDEPL